MKDKTNIKNYQLNIRLTRDLGDKVKILKKKYNVSEMIRKSISDYYDLKKRQ